jgi:alkylation response protein AidB-like acyl-CoA dehydrogenase
LQTRAKKDGDNWIINGSKMWITNSHEAEVFLIFANVGNKNFVGLIVDTHLATHPGRSKQRLQRHHMLRGDKGYGHRNRKKGAKARN